MTNPSRVQIHKSWNTVYGPKPHPELPEAVFELAADCARRAIEEPPADQSGFDRWVRMTAIGQAAEMLVKATLAGIDPVLIAEKNSSTHTLWALAGITRQLSRGKVATVGGTEALRRLNECKPPAPPGVPEPKWLFEIRHGAQHLALSPTDKDLDAALTELVTLVDSVFKIRDALNQSADLNAFWSPKHFAIVEARRKAGYERLLKYYGEAIGEGKADYAKLIAGLSDNDRIRVVGELEARLPTTEDDQTSRKHNCPACGNYMWVVYDVHREIDVDDSDAPHSVGLYAIVSATVNHAECPVCNLHLDQEDLILTDVPFSLDLGIDQATDEEEDGWRDARDVEWRDEWEYADIDPADYGYEEEEDGPEA